MVAQMLWCRRKSHHNVWDNAELISISLDWWVLLVLEQAQSSPASSPVLGACGCLELSLCLNQQVKVKSHKIFFTHRRHVTFKLPITPPTNRYKGISGWTGQSSKNFIPEWQKWMLSQVIRFCNKLYSENYRCCKWSVGLTPKTCIQCLLKWGLN